MELQIQNWLCCMVLDHSLGCSQDGNGAAVIWRQDWRFRFQNDLFTYLRGLWQDTSDFFFFFFLHMHLLKRLPECLHNMTSVFPHSKRGRQKLQYLLWPGLKSYKCSLPQYQIGYTGQLLSMWESTTEKVWIRRGGIHWWWGCILEAGYHSPLREKLGLSHILFLLLIGNWMWNLILDCRDNGALGVAGPQDGMNVYIWIRFL